MHAIQVIKRDSLCGFFFLWHGLGWKWFDRFSNKIYFAFYSFFIALKIDLDLSYGTYQHIEIIISKTYYIQRKFIDLVEIC